MVHRHAVHDMVHLLLLPMQGNFHDVPGTRSALRCFGTRTIPGPRVRWLGIIVVSDLVKQDTRAGGRQAYCGRG